MKSREIIYLMQQPGEQVEDFYDEKNEYRQLDRRDSRLLNHRVFNNWVKSTLIKLAFKRLRTRHPNLE